MKSSHKSFSRTLWLDHLYFLAMVALLAACESSYTQTSPPTSSNHTPTLSPTTTETPWPSSFRYTVMLGETCTSIAYSFDVSVNSILELNNLPASCMLEPNQQLIIPYATISNIPTSTRKPIDVIKVSTTLDFRRNGKIYVVTVATAHFILEYEDLYKSLTPPPKLPEKPSDSIIYRAKIKEQTDLDSDGEQEFIVLLNECEDFACSHFVSYIKIYKYNLERDDYYFFDEYKTAPESIEFQTGY